MEISKRESLRRWCNDWWYDPIVLVVKKNAQLLKKPQKNGCQKSSGFVGDDEDKYTKRQSQMCPLLLIDDEADNASINTKDKKNVSKVRR